MLGHHGVQLSVHVAPLAHAPGVDELLTQAGLLLPVGQLVGGLRRAMPAPLLDPLPQAKGAHELRAFVIEGLVPCIGCRLGLQGSVTHVLAAHGTGNHQHLGETGTVFRGQDHAANLGVQRQTRQGAAQIGQRQLLIHSIQLSQQGIAVGNGFARRRLQEGEVLHVTQAQALHAQNDAGQGAAQDLGVGEGRPGGKARFVVKPDAHARSHTAATASTLVGCGLADRLHLQLFHLVSVAVALDARRAGVHHESDAGHGQRGLRHVCGQHDAPPVAGGKHAVLFGLAQACKERQYVGAAQHRM